jgi:hypothetical protein
MAHYNFEKDLADGQQAEAEVMLLLAGYFKVPESDISRNNTSAFDLSINSLQLTFEVKNDLMAAKTGNVAVEYESRGRASGLAISQALYWVYKFSNKYYLLHSNRLKQELFDNKNYFRLATGGDAGSNTKMFLIKVPEFISWGTAIN